MAAPAMASSLRIDAPAFVPHAVQDHGREALVPMATETGRVSALAHFEDLEALLASMEHSAASGAPMSPLAMHLATAPGVLPGLGVLPPVLLPPVLQASVPPYGGAPLPPQPHPAVAAAAAAAAGDVARALGLFDVPGAGLPHGVAGVGRAIAGLQLLATAAPQVRPPAGTPLAGLAGQLQAPGVAFAGAAGFVPAAPLQAPGSTVAAVAAGALLPAAPGAALGPAEVQQQTPDRRPGMPDALKVLWTPSTTVPGDSPNEMPATPLPKAPSQALADNFIAARTTMLRLRNSLGATRPPDDVRLHAREVSVTTAGGALCDAKASPLEPRSRPPKPTTPAAPRAPAGPPAQPSIPQPPLQPPPLLQPTEPFGLLHLAQQLQPALLFQQPQMLPPPPALPQPLPVVLAPPSAVGAAAGALLLNMVQGRAIEEPAMRSAPSDGGEGKVLLQLLNGGGAKEASHGREERATSTGGGWDGWKTAGWEPAEKQWQQDWKEDWKPEGQKWEHREKNGHEWQPAWKQWDGSEPRKLPVGARQLEDGAAAAGGWEAAAVGGAPHPDARAAMRQAAVAARGGGGLGGKRGGGRRRG